MATDNWVFPNGLSWDINQRGFFFFPSLFKFRKSKEIFLISYEIILFYGKMGEWCLERFLEGRGHAAVYQGL